MPIIRVLEVIHNNTFLYVSCPMFGNCKNGVKRGKNVYVRIKNMIDRNLNGVQVTQPEGFIGMAVTYEPPAVTGSVEVAQIGRLPLNAEAVQKVIDQGVTPVDVQQRIVSEGQRLRPDAINILRIFRGMFGGSVRLEPDGSRQEILPQYAFQSHTLMEAPQNPRV